MHRRDCELIAKTIKRCRNYFPSAEQFNASVDEFCKALKGENASFNSEKFIEYINKGR